MLNLCHILIFLFSGQHGTVLDLATRLDIAIDVAHAITYLHLYAGERLENSECRFLFRPIQSSEFMKSMAFCRSIHHTSGHQILKHSFDGKFQSQSDRFRVFSVRSYRYWCDTCVNASERNSRVLGSRVSKNIPANTEKWCLLFRGVASWIVHRKTAHWAKERGKWEGNNKMGMYLCLP